MMDDILANPGEVQKRLEKPEEMSEQERRFWFGWGGSLLGSRPGDNPETMKQLNSMITTIQFLMKDKENELVDKLVPILMREVNKALANGDIAVTTPNPLTGMPASEL